MAHFIALTCSALARSVYAAAAVAEPVVSVRLFDQGLHNAPRNLRGKLQAAIDAIAPGECDAILLAYGICGTATLGLTSHHTPLVLPRAHDCITLYLGSRERYKAEFDSFPGTYWYSQDYLERNPSSSGVALGAASIEIGESIYQQYIEKYGQENADYLMQVMGEWGKHYNRAVYIDTGLGDGAAYEQRARDQADQRGWRFDRREGDRRLINMLMDGKWSEEDFLIVPPGHRVVQSVDDKLIVAESEQP
ncbi:MAG: DUF1638 domain-containing protein [Chloroflexi bacterium]|nr:DUF1638 domain-containing protein [Chloroflexota bacterium]